MFLSSSQRSSQHLASLNLIRNIIFFGAFAMQWEREATEISTGKFSQPKTAIALLALIPVAFVADVLCPQFSLQQNYSCEIFLLIEKILKNSYFDSMRGDVDALDQQNTREQSYVMQWIYFLKEWPIVFNKIYLFHFTI